MKKVEDGATAALLSKAGGANLRSTGRINTMGTEDIDRVKD